LIEGFKKRLNVLINDIIYKMALIKISLIVEFIVK